MPLKSLLIRLLLAVGLSAVILIVFIIIQGALFFPEHVKTLRTPAQTTIIRLSPISDGTSAVVLLRHQLCVTDDRLSTSVGVWSFDGGGCSFRKLPLNFTPFDAVGVRTGQRLFVSSQEGRLYVVDLNSPAPQLHLLGIHGEGFMPTLECSDDGSIVFAADRRVLAAWRPDPPALLWRRDDLDVNCACFSGQTSRLFCGMSGGNGCVLDGLTGKTLQAFRVHCSYPFAMDISASEARLAALNGDGTLIVSDLATNQPLWRKEFLRPAAEPRFSPDGEFLAAPSEDGKATLLVLSAATGQLHAELTGATSRIAGIAWLENRVVCAWDDSGTITAWNVTSRSLLRQFSVECLATNTGSS